MLPPPSPPSPPLALCSYINGKPFVVREAERPFSNLEYTGIDRERVEGMEARLKQDVLQEVRGVVCCGVAWLGVRWWGECGWQRCAVQGCHAC